MVDEKGALAEKLKRLFEEVRKPDGKRYTQTEMVAATKGVLTRVHLWKLRNGTSPTPDFTSFRR